MLLLLVSVRHCGGSAGGAGFQVQGHGQVVGGRSSALRVVPLVRVLQGKGGDF